MMMGDDDDDDDGDGDGDGEDGMVMKRIQFAQKKKGVGKMMVVGK